ncbi:MAG: hypothetical protein DLM52_04530 [Chthoniobacterales bacterium]|nr:MAG: hypothetical protein DLM52_04530 [Chthoniobacterales bacterium]
MWSHARTLCILSAALLTSARAAATGAQVLPSSCEENRFYVTPTTIDGLMLRFFTDTGGGRFLVNSAAERLKLPKSTTEVDGEKVSGVKLPSWRADASIPPLSPNILPVMDSSSPEFKNATYRGIDGLLGAAWFADRVWTFDYPGRRLLFGGDLPAHQPKDEVRLGFQTDPKTHARPTNFPRITVEIDGAPIDLLFDTGASTELTDAARKQIADDRPTARATSFIVAEVFARWHERHPDWTVIENAEVGTNEAMIKVPRVQIAGCDAGPVWFTRRPDKNFRQWMSQWMDKPIDGSLGGNGLRNFRVTVSYPAAVAVFQ